MRIIGRVFMAIWIALLLSACAGAKQPVLTEQANGSSISLNKTDTLTVSLPGNPSTGYVWEVDQIDPKVLQPTGDWVFKADSSLSGAPGTVTWQFRPANSGTSILRMIYHRPWEKDQAPAKTYVLNISVR
jgi:inhibitor of cysteine peptidase